MDINKTFPDRLKKVRLENKLSQRKLEEMAHTTAATISAYEKGGKKPSLENIANIAEVLNVSIDWLCGIADDMTPKLKTLKDVAELLIKIDSEGGFKIEKIHGGASDSEMCFGFYVEDYIPSFVENWGNLSDLQIRQRDVCDFFDSWMKFKKLLEDRKIDEEIFDLWKEKELKKLSKWDIVINDLPF